MLNLGCDPSPDEETEIEPDVVCDEDCVCVGRGASLSPLAGVLVATEPAPFFAGCDEEGDENRGRNTFAITSPAITTKTAIYIVASTAL